MNSNLPPGAENDPNAPWNNEDEYECNVCGAPILRPGTCDSPDCIKTDNEL